MIQLFDDVHVGAAMIHLCYRGQQTSTATDRASSSVRSQHNSMPAIQHSTTSTHDTGLLMVRRWLGWMYATCDVLSSDPHRPYSLLDRDVCSHDGNCVWHWAHSGGGLMRWQRPLQACTLQAGSTHRAGAAGLHSGCAAAATANSHTPRQKSCNAATALPKSECQNAAAAAAATALLCVTAAAVAASICRLHTHVAGSLCMRDKLVVTTHKLSFDMRVRTKLGHTIFVAGTSSWGVPCVTLAAAQQGG